MSRLLYEQSTSYSGHLIIPFIYQRLAGQNIFSYRLLSEWGYKGRLHRSENPGGIYSSSAAGITTIAKEYLHVLARNEDMDYLLGASHTATNGTTASMPDGQTISIQSKDYFKNRYTYQNNLIIIFHARHKFFYDHYPPTSLKNIAAPKIFNTERSCLTWIKNGIDASLASANAVNSYGNPSA